MTVAIVAILAAVAYPSFSAYVMKSRRTDAYVALSSLMHHQERLRSNQVNFATLEQLGMSPNSPDGRYVISLSLSPDEAIPGYTATATATANGGQGADREGDTSCATLSVVVSGASLTYAPAACWKR